MAGEKFEVDSHGASMRIGDKACPIMSMPLAEPLRHQHLDGLTEQLLALIA